MNSVYAALFHAEPSGTGPFVGVTVTALLSPHTFSSRDSVQVPLPPQSLPTASPPLEFLVLLIVWYLLLGKQRVVPCDLQLGARTASVTVAG